MVAEKRTQADWDLRMSRVFDAPRAMVFDAWRTPASVSRWFAPKGLTVPECAIDFRVGGRFDLTMAMDGFRHTMTSVYVDIVEGERIVFRSSLNDQPEGNEILTTVTFEETGAKTTLSVHQEYWKVAKLPAHEGWSSTLDNLGEHLAAVARG